MFAKAASNSSTNAAGRSGGGRHNVETARKSDALVPRNSAAIYFVERSATLFDEGARRPQIGKAPAGIGLIVPHNPATVSRLNVLRFTKTHDLPIQFDFQSGLWNSKLDDIRIPEPPRTICHSGPFSPRSYVQ